jgi:hypothetical protein
LFGKPTQVRLELIHANHPPSRKKVERDAGFCPRPAEALGIGVLVSV